MSRRIVFLEVLAALLLASCGSSSHKTPNSAPSGPAVTTQTTAPTPPPTTTTATTPTTTTSGPGTPATTGSAPAGGQEKIRVPATFTIRGGGRLSPPSVSSPAFLAVQFTVASGDGKAHRVVLRTPTPHSLRVAAGRRSSVLIRGLRPGHYPITVDGTVRGALDIGGEPGP